MSAAWQDSQGRVHVGTISKEEWERDRAATPEVHIVSPDRYDSGGDE